MKRPTITVFGSGLPKWGDSHYAEAHTLGMELARRGFAVCTGGYGGVMEAACRGAKSAGGSTIGVTSNFFATSANAWIDKEICVKHWRDRLFQLVELGHGYVVCRGGTGTLVELAVVLEMINKKVMRARPVVTMGDFWRPVIQCVSKIENARYPGGKAGKRFSPIRLAKSPLDAVEFLAEHFGLSPRIKGSSVRLRPRTHGKPNR